MPIIQQILVDSPHVEYNRKIHICVFILRDIYQASLTCHTLKGRNSKIQREVNLTSLLHMSLLESIKLCPRSL